MGRRAKLGLAAVAALTVAAAIPWTVNHLHESAWRVRPEDRPFVDRALAGAVSVYGSSPGEYRKSTRPRVRRAGDRVCVDLVTADSDGDGGYSACYDRRGRRLSQRAIACTFGAEPLADRLWALVW